MSLTVNQTTAAAQAAIQIANNLKSAFVLATEFIDYNNAVTPGWATLTGPAVDANGLVVGTDATPAEIFAVVGALNAFLHYWKGDSQVPLSAFGTSLEAVANPLV